MKTTNFPARKVARQYAAEHRAVYPNRHITAAEVYEKNINNGGIFGAARRRRSKRSAV